MIDADDWPRVANDDNDDGKTSRIEEGGGGGGLGGKAHRRNVVVVTKSSQQEPLHGIKPVARLKGGKEAVVTWVVKADGDGSGKMARWGVDSSSLLVTS